MKKAQSVLEYAVVVAVFISAILAMQIYLKRSVQGRLRETADSIGQQYSPGNTSSVMYMSDDSNSQSTVTTQEIDDGATKKLLTTSTWSIIAPGNTTKRWGTENVGKFEATLFGATPTSSPGGSILTWEQMYQVWRTDPNRSGNTSRSTFLKEMGINSGNPWDMPSSTPGLTLRESFNAWCTENNRRRSSDRAREDFLRSIGSPTGTIWDVPFTG